MKALPTSSPWGFRLHSLKSYCEAMKRLGLEDICLMMGDPARLPLATARSKQAVKEARQMVKDSGLGVLETAISLDAARDLDFALSLGAKFIRICEVWKPEGTTLKKVASTLSTLLPDLPEDVTLILENHGGLMADAEGCLRLFEELGNPRAKLNFDAANFVHFGGQEPLSAFEKLSGHIGFLHVKNVTSLTANKGGFCRISEGKIDYAPLLKLLAKHSGAIPVAIEYEEPSDVEQGSADDLKELKRLLSETGCAQ